MTEFLVVAQQALGRRLGEPLALELAAIQADFHTQQARLVASFDRGLLSHDQYLSAFGELAQGTMVRVRKLLGDETFSQVFGKVGFQPGTIIDKATFDARSVRRHG